MLEAELQSKEKEEGAVLGIDNQIVESSLRIDESENH